MPEPPRLQTLETRLERIEALIVELQVWAMDNDLGRDRRLAEIRERLDLQFAHILQLCDEIKAKARQ